MYEQIRKTGRVRRGDIGVRAQTVTPVLAAGLGLPRDHGVVLSDVLPGGPGAKAGLLAGDFIVSVDGKPMENGRQIQVSLYRRYIGDVVELEILRNREPMKMFVAMTERSGFVCGLTPAADPREHLVPRLGILGVTLDPQIAQMLPVARVVQAWSWPPRSRAPSTREMADWLQATSCTRSIAGLSPGFRNFAWRSTR